MKQLKIALITLHLLICGSAYSDEQAKVEAGKLLDAMNMDLIMQQSISVMLESQIKQKPEIAPFKEIMHAFLNKHMSFGAIRQDFIDMYSNEFTAEELSDIREFYETKSGKKALEKMPTLMSQGAAIGSKRVQDNLSELQESIKSEIVRLKQLPDHNNTDNSQPQP